MNRRSPLVAVSVLSVTALLTLTGCGARVNDSLRQQAADQALGRNGGSTGSQAGGSAGGDTSGGTTGGSSGGVSPATTGGSTGGATGGTTGGATGGTRGGTAGGTKGGTTGGTSGGTTGGGNNGGATDVGVTATSITVGNVADASGPVPGLFKGAFTGTQAYFNMINSQGGVNGRQLKVDFGDGQLNCSANQSATQARVGKVFAFVGNFSLYDSCGAPVLAQHQEVPNVSNYLSDDVGKQKSDFATAPVGHGWRTGPLAYYAKTYPNEWKHVGAIYAGVGSGPTLWANTKKAIANSGGHVDHDESYGATDTNFTGAVIRMQQSGVKMIYVNTTDGSRTAYLVNAIRQQNLNWPIIFGATAYATGFLQQSGDRANGVLNDQQFAQFFNADDAAKIPTVAAFQKWMKFTDKDQPLDIFGAYGWTSAGLFVDALKKAGPKATRKSLLAALATFTNYDSYGMFASANPAGKKPAVCWILNKVVGGKFVRQAPSPAVGFYCTGASFFTAS
ncbi:MAG: ABC-type branched-chain amino acid transport system periplasmic component-like protein [Frankiales bacterium]|nr:ABC-type branched-chain amino acid transport system periplasmic component-like protein [Frankiales bacterium]